MWQNRALRYERQPFSYPQQKAVETQPAIGARLCRRLAQAGNGLYALPAFRQGAKGKLKLKTDEGPREEAALHKRQVSGPR
jgi:hypothetical protein